MVTARFLTTEKLPVTFTPERLNISDLTDKPLHTRFHRPVFSRIRRESTNTGHQSPYSCVFYAAKALKMLDSLQYLTIYCSVINGTINFDDFDILTANSNKFKLLLRESILIKCDKPILNRKINFFPLELFD